MEQEKIAGLISTRRKELGLTQRALAERLNITDKAVSKWERGLSFPDITILSELSAALGITEGELLRGELAKTIPQHSEKQPEQVVLEVLTYAQKAEKRNWKRIWAGIMFVFTGALLAAVLVCVICDLAINQKLTWSLIVTGSCALAWCVAGPAYFCRRHKLMWAEAGLTVGVLPFLLLLEFSTGGGWFFPVALPIAVLGLIWLWAVTVVAVRTRLSPWNKVAVGIFLAVPVNLGTNWVLSQTGGSGTEPWQLAVNMIGTLVLGFVCILIGRLAALKRTKA